MSAAESSAAVTDFAPAGAGPGRSTGPLAALLLLPTALLLLLIVGVPVARLLYDSLFHFRLTEPGRRFVGLANYRDLLADPRFVHSVRVTLVVVAVTVPGALLGGLGLALFAHARSRLRHLARLSILLPWAMPPSFVGLIFAWFFQSEHGVVNDLVQRLGGSPQAYLLSGPGALAAVCAASVWKASSFVALIVVAGLQTIDPGLIEAALVEGAGRWQRFRYVILPALAPSLWVAAIFRTLAALQTFDVAYAMTRGGPNHATETLALLINKTTTEFLNVGYGSSMAVLILAVSLLLTAPYLRRLARQAEA